MGLQDTKNTVVVFKHFITFRFMTKLQVILQLGLKNIPPPLPWNVNGLKSHDRLPNPNM